MFFQVYFVKGTAPPINLVIQVTRAHIVRAISAETDRQQTPSKVSAQLDVGHGATINHFNVGEFVVYVIYACMPHWSRINPSINLVTHSSLVSS